MALSTFSIRMEKELKQDLDTLCAKMGMTTSTAINIFARTMVREQRIPFEVTAGNQNHINQDFPLNKIQKMEK